MYFDRGPDNWIDTFIGLESELLRYKRSFLVFRFENETDMGRGADPKMIFDPNRGRWTFSLGSRTSSRSTSSSSCSATTAITASTAGGPARTSR